MKKEVESKESLNKVFLTELEKEKITNINTMSESLRQMFASIGELEINKKILEKRTLEFTEKLEKQNIELQNELFNKYGKFSLGQDGEVITE